MLDLNHGCQIDPGLLFWLNFGVCARSDDACCTEDFVKSWVDGIPGPIVAGFFGDTP